VSQGVYGGPVYLNFVRLALAHVSKLQGIVNMLEVHVLGHRARQWPDSSGESSATSPALTAS